MNLLLFDIDGTILRTNGAGTRAVNRAFEKILGHRGAMAGVDAAGKTDPLILREMFMNKLSRDFTEAEALQIFGEYVAFLKEEVAAGGVETMPGIRFLLESLSLRDDMLLGIATGNIEEGAWIKLRRAGLDAHFAFGGFGSDSESRETLVRAAIERAGSHERGAGGFEKVFVIGDTPFDIIHGRAAGAVTVAVATVRYKAAELSEHDPDHLFDDLTDYDGFLDIFG
jgi:phosphoglycolate phosphatase-like HAD superfamily hydrolase